MDAATATDFPAFDPNATVDTNAFADIVDTSGVDAEQQARIQEELKTGAFGTVDVQDFSAFNASDTVVTTGQYAFAVEQKFLKEATTVTKFTTAVAKGGFGAVKVTIFQNKLRLATFNQSAFSETFIPLHAPVANIETGKEVSFIFDQSVLGKIAQSFVDAVINFTYDAEKSLLTINSGKTNLQLSTYGKVEFIDYHSKLGTPRYVRQVYPELFRKAIGYAGMFVKKDDLQLNMSLIDTRAGQVIGGNYYSIGVFSSPRLGELELRIKYEIIKIIEAVLPRFHAENTHLFETDSFYILRDENLYVGFEKTNFKFPSIDKMLAMKADDFVLVPRAQLLNSLFKLSVVSVDRDLLVRTKLQGSGNDATLTLMTKDSSGKTSTDSIACFRGANAGSATSYEDVDIYVNISAFIKVVQHFDSANCQLEVLGNKALVIRDSQENEWETATLLSVLTEEKVAAMKQQRETSKAA